MRGKRVQRVILNRMDLRVPITDGFQAALEQASIRDLQRRGKYIIGLLDNSQGFVLHLGMSGRIHIYAPEDVYKPAKHDHVIFEMEDSTRIVFNDPRRFGMLYLVHQDTWQGQSPFDLMGPEPLGNGFSDDILYARLKNRRTPIKTALLNQHIVAGVGNIYACEALFESGIAPERSADSLTKEEAARLAASVRDVLARAIEAGGSTLRDYAQTDGSLGYFQHSFSVYDREGHSCPGCDCDTLKTGGVQRMVQAGRSTFYCERKQA